MDVLDDLDFFAPWVCPDISPSTDFLRFVLAPPFFGLESILLGAPISDAGVPSI